MAPICVNNGSNFTVSVSLRSMFIIITLVLTSTILTMTIYNKHKSYKNDLCSNYGVQSAADTTGSMILIILTTIMSVMLISSIVRAATTAPKMFKSWVLPGIYLIITAIFIVLLATRPSETPPNAQSSDSRVAQWCLEGQGDMNGLNIVSSGILGITLGGVMAWLSLVLSRRCAL